MSQRVLRKWGLAFPTLALLMYPNSLFASPEKGPAPLPKTSVAEQVNIRNWDPNKELRMDILLYIETEKGPGTIHTELKMGLNYEELGELMISGRKITLFPTLNHGESEIIITLFDLHGSKLLESKVPFNERAKLKTRPEPNPDGVTKVELILRRI